MAQQLRLPGIIGGLGPAAHIEFEKRLLAEGVRRGAQADQDHIAWVLVSATNVPDRTERILAAHTKECVDELIVAARRLLAAGAEFACVPCNTAHALRDAVVAATGLPWLDLIDQTCEALAAAYPPGAKILVLQTTGTAQTRLYADRLERHGFEEIAFAPDSREQSELMRAIDGREFGIKATGVEVDPRALARIRDTLAQSAHDARCVVAGCTELSIAFARDRSLSPLPLVDPLDVLATAAYDVALGRRPLPALPNAARL